MLKDLIKKIEGWKEYSEKNPYSGLKESTIYGRVLRELYEVQANMEIKQQIEEDCDSYHDGRCWGTRERDVCSCNGKRSKCTFYPEKGELSVEEIRRQAEIKTAVYAIMKLLYSKELTIVSDSKIFVMDRRTGKKQELVLEE